VAVKLAFAAWTQLRSALRVPSLRPRRGWFRSCACVCCAGCGVGAFLGAVSMIAAVLTAVTGTAGPAVPPITCPGITVSQGFGDTPWEHPHTGIDIVCPRATPVVAIAGGVFQQFHDAGTPCAFFPGLRGGFGTYGLLIEADGVEVLYGHLDGFVAADGQTVAAGTVLGLEGSTGCSTGDHLHFEVRVAGRAVNPCGFLPAGYPDVHQTNGRCWGAAKP